MKLLEVCLVKLPPRSQFLETAYLKSVMKNIQFQENAHGSQLHKTFSFSEMPLGGSFTKLPSLKLPSEVVHFTKMLPPKIDIYIYYIDLKGTPMQCLGALFCETSLFCEMPL